MTADKIRAMKRAGAFWFDYADYALALLREIAAQSAEQTEIVRMSWELQKLAQPAESAPPADAAARIAARKEGK